MPWHNRATFSAGRTATTSDTVIGMYCGTAGIRDLVERARVTGSASVLSVAVPAPGIDPLDVYAAAPRDSRFYWESPHDGLAIAASGVADWIAPFGKKRFHDSKDYLSHLRSRVITEDGSPILGPRVLMGFSYDFHERLEDVWNGFPSSQVLLPKVMVVAQADEFQLTANVVIDGHSDPESVEEEMRLLLDVDFQTGSYDPPQVPVNAHGHRMSDFPDRETWMANASTILREVGRGEYQKTVLARRLDVEADAYLDPVTALRRFRTQYPETAFGAFAGAGKTFIFASPERLVRLQDRTVQVSCLAGTARRAGSDHDDQALAARLLTDPKELREHDLVVQYVRERLEPVCDSLSVPTSPTVLTFRNVHHLFTPVEGNVHEGLTMLDLIELLHPTPAVSSVSMDSQTPSHTAFEQFDRGWYAGAVGWSDLAGNGDSAVAIRSALLHGTEAHLFAGCGLVTGSDPSREWTESEAKLQPMLSALELRQT